ncbi:hypothetical protein NMY22_g2666 [Coprinellus aureogranulatus]|nr:hypothetical protein NMY22_g2666 [Coprinellus aureogranulatus]
MKKAYPLSPSNTPRTPKQLPRNAQLSISASSFTAANQIASLSGFVSNALTSTSLAPPTSPPTHLLLRPHQPQHLRLRHTPRRFLQDP